jgi:hypothetical protein
MKKSTINNLIPAIGKWSLWIGLCVLCFYISINSFVNLHEGASIRDVEGRKYSPVLNELVLMTGVSIFLLLLLKVTTKLKMLWIILIGIIVFSLIGWFGYWAFNFTHQNPVEGFLTVLILIGSISLVTALALWYESYARSKRNKSNKSKK